jgi:hypothetical protein
MLLKEVIRKSLSGCIAQELLSLIKMRYAAKRCRAARRVLFVHLHAVLVEEVTFNASVN